jgi:hypothetical protein
MLEHLGVPRTGSAPGRLQNALIKHGIPLVGREESNQVRARKVSPHNTIPDIEVFVENSTYTNLKGLKQRLLDLEVATNSCAVCGLGPVWNGLPLTLQIDHINGERTDNRITNLRIICPNCHTQTKTYGGGNRKGTGVSYPEDEELLRLSKDLGTSAVARMLGCSPSSVSHKVARIKRQQTSGGEK